MEGSWTASPSDEVPCQDTLAPPATSDGRLTPDELIAADLAPSDASDAEDTESSSQSSGVSPADSEVPLVVHKVIAGWDRNFLLCHENKADAPRPVDQRFHSKDTQILRLDNDILEQLPFLSASEQVPQELLVYLETVFASCACLNASYLKEDDAHFNCSEANPGVDLEAARHGFHCIQDAKNTSVGEVLWAARLERPKGPGAPDCAQVPPVPEDQARVLRRESHSCPHSGWWCLHIWRRGVWAAGSRWQGKRGGA